MIKFFITVAILAGLALSCQRPKTETSDSAVSPDNGKVLQHISFDTISGVTKSGILVQDAKEMVQNYKRWAGRHPVSGTKQNTRSVWFHLDTLDSLVNLMKLERIALQQGDPNKKDGVTDGVRIYFGRYKTHDSANMKERNTLLFVSTVWVDSAQGHRDYHNNQKRTVPANNGELSPPNNFGLSWGSGID